MTSLLLRVISSSKFLSRLLSPEQHARLSIHQLGGAKVIVGMEYIMGKDGSVNDDEIV